MEQALIPINDIVKKGWSLYRANLVKFLKPVAIYVSALIVFALYNYAVSRLGWTNALLTIAIPILLYLIMIFVEIWMIIYLTNIIYKTYNNQQYSDDALFMTAIKRVPTFIWLGLLLFLILLGGFFLLIIPAIFWGIWYSYSIYVYAVEDKKFKATEALSASKKLIKGRAWDTFGRSFFPSFYWAILIYLGGLILFLILGAAGIGWDTAFLIAYILSVLAILVSIPVFMAFKVIVYNDLKNTRPNVLAGFVQQPQPETIPTQPAAPIL